MNCLSEISTQMVGAKTGMSTMSLAAKHLHWQVDRIIRLALTGKIDLYHLIGRDDFEGYLVDEMQVLSIIQMPGLADRMTKEDAAARFFVDIVSIENLMRLAASDGTPLIRRVVALSGALRYRYQVSKVDFDRFIADHVSIGTLAADLGKSKDQVFADLQLQGVSPIPCNVTPDNLVYRRADL